MEKSRKINPLCLKELFFSGRFKPGSSFFSETSGQRLQETGFVGVLNSKLAFRLFSVIGIYVGTSMFKFSSSVKMKILNQAFSKKA